MKTVWFGVGGSTAGPAQARAELRKALGNPEAAIRKVVGYRERVDALSDGRVPGNPLLTRSVAWSSRCWPLRAAGMDDLQLRAVNAGQAYPPPAGTLGSIVAGSALRLAGSTRGCSVTRIWRVHGLRVRSLAGQFGPDRGSLRALRDVSEIVQRRAAARSCTRVTPDGAVLFGANADAGNTDESSKYPSAAALILALDRGQAVPR